MKYIYIKVVCCNECNSLLLDSLTLEVLERETYIKQKLARRYAKALSMPTWTEEEIEDLGPSLQTTVRRGLVEADNARERLNYKEGINAYLEYLRDRNDL